METRLSRFEQLLREFNQLQPLNLVEPNIFSIGSKGYYENPTTDILKFFIDTNGQHQLGNTVLNALFSCLNTETQSFDSALVAVPEREVLTKTGKRIDLLLEGNDWVMVIENKIFHHQNNPFDDYMTFVQTGSRERFDGKKGGFVVLAPDKEPLPSGWQFVSYGHFISALKQQLAEKFISQPVNKWVLLLREFVLHLEGLMSQPSVNQDTLDFVLNNLSTIKDIQDTKEQSLKQYQQQLKTQLQNMLNQEVVTNSEHWGRYPVIRFALPTWRDTEADVVLCFAVGDEPMSFHVFVRLRETDDEYKADQLILANWNPKRVLEGEYRKYSVKVNKMEKQEIVQFLHDRLLEIDKFEFKK